MTKEDTKITEPKPIGQVLEVALQQLSQTIQKDGEPQLPDFKKECQRCWQEFPMRDTFLNRHYPQTCPACEEKEATHKRDRDLDRLKTRWASLCPDIFKSTDFAGLPCQMAAKRVLEWKFGHSGIILHGPTGMGKSRSAWLLLKKLHFEGKSIVALNSLAALTYASLYSKSTADVERWVQSLIFCDVLMLDDIFKVKLTDSFESIIFSVIDQRTEGGRPMIVTANDTSETLVNRLTADRAEPLLRRLKEFCSPITFE
jgi:DNA replication protein DnaC